MGQTMGISKKLTFDNIFIFLFLALFPLGQIIRIGILQPIDVITGLGAIYAIYKKQSKPDIFKYFERFLIVAFFSWLFSLFIFQDVNVGYGFLYFLRLASYFYFLIYVWNFVNKTKKNNKLIKDSLLAVSVISALFGWVQFFLIPDIKPFFTWGWDMHLFRLVGTFLDPTFLGLIIVFGLVQAVYKTLENRSFKNIALTGFLMLSLAFTYSRASYIAFAAGILAIIYFQKNLKKLLFLILGLGIIAFMLPTSKNHSIELFRTFSAIAKVENYQTTLKIFEKSPVFGIGYDNLCIAYQKFVGPQSFSSHACSGSDSSMLFVLTTTGVIGLISFAALVFGIAAEIDLKKEKLFIVSGIGVTLHSLFSNSLFYPWILGYLIILLAAELRSKAKS